MVDIQRMTRIQTHDVFSCVCCGGGGVQEIWQGVWWAGIGGVLFYVTYCINRIHISIKFYQYIPGLHKNSDRKYQRDVTSKISKGKQSFLYVTRCLFLICNVIDFQRATWLWGVQK